ncbi:MAG TPA: type II CAAX endopeptidase family protein [Thermoanaerobaculia bacterium]|nr:type II CAAX endopeptidase family protein [Thermoanaerobaculia bacterium]
MNPYIIPLACIAAVFLIIVALSERRNLFACDHFTSPVLKWIAYAWLGVFLLSLTALVVNSSRHVPTVRELGRIPFYSLFMLHAILVMFLVVWWLLSGRPPVRQFLNIPAAGGGQAVMTGLAVGIGGWIFTIVMALLIVAILAGAGLFPKAPEPSPMIAWMAALPLWKKALIVCSAMTVEEAFFRGWLQKRVGLIASTALFALAHTGLGQPFLLIGVSIISLVIGFTFYRTKNLIPGVIAHGVFDAVQLFVIIPIAFRLTGIQG